MSQEASTPQLQPFTYTETADNRAHPLSDLQLSDQDLGVIDATMQDINQRREVLASRNPRQVFAGITVDEERGKTLLVVDLVEGDESRRFSRGEYIVRTSPLTSEHAGEVSEEHFPDDDSDQRADWRNGGTILETEALGRVEVDPMSP